MIMMIMIIMIIMIIIIIIIILIIIIIIIMMIMITIIKIILIMIIIIMILIMIDKIVHFISHLYFQNEKIVKNEQFIKGEIITNKPTCIIPIIHFSKIPPARCEVVIFVVHFKLLLQSFQN